MLVEIAADSFGTDDDDARRRAISSMTLTLLWARGGLLSHAVCLDLQRIHERRLPIRVAEEAGGALVVRAACLGARLGAIDIGEDACGAGDAPVDASRQLAVLFERGERRERSCHL